MHLSRLLKRCAFPDSVYRAYGSLRCASFPIFFQGNRVILDLGRHLQVQQKKIKGRSEKQNNSIMFFQENQNDFSLKILLNAERIFHNVRHKFLSNDLKDGL